MTVWRVTLAAWCEPCKFSSGGLFLQEVPPPVKGSTLPLRGLSLTLSSEWRGLRGERLAQITQLLPLAPSSLGVIRTLGLLGL